MISCDEKVKRLTEALAQSIYESYKRELLSIVDPCTKHDVEFLERVRRDRDKINSMEDLAEYVDTNMIPPESECLLGPPLIVARNEQGELDDDGEDEDGQWLAVNAFNRMQEMVDEWLRKGGLKREEVRVGA